MLLEESLEGILEVVTEGQVPQVVHKARETQSLLDEKCIRARIVRDARRCPQTVLSQGPDDVRPGGWIPSCGSGHRCVHECFDRPTQGAVGVF